MTFLPRCLATCYLAASVVAASPALAQTSAKADSAGASEDAHQAPLEFGVAGGALSYEGGRQEQAFGAVLRWATTPWLAFSSTPTAVHVHEPSASAVGSFVATTG